MGRKAPLSDADRLDLAYEKRANLLADSRLSLPEGLGYTAVICSTESTEERDSPAAAEQISHFKNETAEIAWNLYTKGRTVEDIVTDSINDVRAVVGDEECTDIIVVGNGSYSTLWLSDNHLSWWNLSQMSNHLKTGEFTQRTCGHIGRTDRLNISLGTFAMANLNKLVAPVGLAINDEHPDESAFRKVYGSDMVSKYELIQISDDLVMTQLHQQQLQTDFLS